ncbi:MAG: hypothetical protein PHN26_04495 [Eubacteriaceae bacterium]|nr:hypothetical protein [Eubacteriaceae bacterium]
MEKNLVIDGVEIDQNRRDSIIIRSLNYEKGNCRTHEKNETAMLDLLERIVKEEVDAYKED